MCNIDGFPSGGPFFGGMWREGETGNELVGPLRAFKYTPEEAMKPENAAALAQGICIAVNSIMGVREVAVAERDRGGVRCGNERPGATEGEQG